MSMIVFNVTSEIAPASGRVKASQLLTPRPVVAHYRRPAMIVLPRRASIVIIGGDASTSAIGWHTFTAAQWSTFSAQDWRYFAASTTSRGLGGHVVASQLLVEEAVSAIAVGRVAASQLVVPMRAAKITRQHVSASQLVAA